MDSLASPFLALLAAVSLKLLLAPQGLAQDKFVETSGPSSPANATA